jgi:hypothetical protein
MKKAVLLPQSDLAKRFCDIFHRRHTTPWQPKEKRAFLAIRDSVNEDDLKNIERRYKTLWPPNSDKNTLRHDLYTFLNNYATEADRANIWAEQHPVRVVRKVIPMPPIPSEPYVPPIRTPEEQEEYDRFIKEFERRKQNREIPKTFKDVQRIMQG